jgi:hypothetical protein
MTVGMPVTDSESYSNYPVAPTLLKGHQEGAVQ